MIYEECRRRAALLRLATEVLGSDALANKWFNVPARGLGGEIPSALCATAEGFSRAETLLLQLKHGIYI